MDHKRNLIVLSVTIFFAACSWNQIVPFLPLYIESMNVTGSVARWSGIIFAMHFLAAFIAQPLWGKLGDRVGRKPMIIRAGFGLVLVYFGLSISTTPWHLAFWRFVNGAVTGFIPGSIALIATNTPDHMSARYVALAQTASAAGGIAGPALGGIMAAVLGYRLSLRVSGVVLLLATLAVWMLVREEKTGTAVERTTIWQDLRAVFESKVLQGVMLTVMLATGLVQGFAPILTLYMRQISPEVPDIIAGGIFSLPGLAFVLVAYRWTKAGERRGFPWTITAGLIGSGLVLIGLGAMTNIWGFAAGYFVYGIFAATLMPSAAALIATKVREDFRGRAYGVQQSASMFGGLVAPLAGGVIGDILGLEYIFVFSGIASLVGVWCLRKYIFSSAELSEGSGSAGSQYKRTA